MQVLSLTWIAYASYYLGRKGFSVTKSATAAALGLEPGALAAIDTGYLAAYAVGQFTSGLLGDRLGARRLLTVGLLVSAIACVAFGLGSSGGALLVAFSLNGLAQATGWPGTNKAIAGYTTREDRGAVMGLWATCYQVGGVASTALATYLLPRAGWRAAFLVPAAWMAALAVVLFRALPDPPPTPLEAAVGGKEEAAESDQRVARRERIAVLRSPLVWSYGASYFCIKMIRYSLLFWLPYYLNTALSYSRSAAGLLSISFEVGGILGTIGFGAASDRARRLPRAAFAAAGLLGLAFALPLYSVVAGLGAAPNFVAMMLVAFCYSGPTLCSPAPRRRILAGATPRRRRWASSTASGRSARSCRATSRSR